MEILDQGAREGVYPGAVLLIAKAGRIEFVKESGYLSLIPEKIPMRRDTIFDLASLTKPLATTLALMGLVDKGKIGLDQPLREIIEESSKSDDKEDLTIRLILSHSAGFADWKPIYLDLMEHRLEERKRILRERLLKEPLVYRPGKDCVYSDLGFMVLEWIIEEVSGMNLNDLIDEDFYKPLSLKRTFLNAGSMAKKFNRKEIAATEDCPWRGRVIQGEVHDENAYALGGYSGHAGLFGIAKEVFIIVDMLREHYIGKRDDFFRQETVKEFFRRQEIVDHCSWALGWDTPSTQGSSSGKYFSSKSVGHLGFAGTSLWMDLERDVTVIFLTNRVHPTRNNQKIKAFRPMLHDSIMVELGAE